MERNTKGETMTKTDREIKRATTKREKWEAAWEEYIEALCQYEERKPLQWERGHVRRFKCAYKRLCRSEKRIKKLDPDYVGQMDKWENERRAAA